MGYCGKDPQIGKELLTFDMDVEEFVEKCNNLSINLYEYPTCKICKKTVYGSYTFNNSGKPIHLDCK